MRIRAAIISAAFLLSLIGSALALDVSRRESKPRPFREYPGREYENFPLPPDYLERTEWQFARLMYPQAQTMREYLDRGGFFMCDDFHDVYEWEIFVASMQKVFPDRHIVDLPKSEPIFHTICDLNDKYQVPGAQYLRSGRTWEQNGFQ